MDAVGKVDRKIEATETKDGSSITTIITTATDRGETINNIREDITATRIAETIATETTQGEKATATTATTATRSIELKMMSGRMTIVAKATTTITFVTTEKTTREELRDSTTQGDSKEEQDQVVAVQQLPQYNFQT